MVSWFFKRLLFFAWSFFNYFFESWAASAKDSRILPPSPPVPPASACEFLPWGADDVILSKLMDPIIFVLGLTKSLFTMKGPVLKYLRVGLISTSSYSPVPAYVPGPDASLIAIYGPELMKEGMPIFGLDWCIEDSYSVADLVLCALNDVLCLLSKPNLCFWFVVVDGPVEPTLNSLGLSFGGDR